jgi:hypothetical protein
MTQAHDNYGRITVPSKLEEISTKKVSSKAKVAEILQVKLQELTDRTFSASR